jgi:hypothetical protein
VIARQHRRRLTGATLLWICVLVVAGSAAEAKCKLPATTQAFAQWGDDSSYVLANGGSFEEKLKWDGTHPPVLTLENNPFLLAGPGQWSMRLTGSQELTSPSLCVNTLHPHLRFVARAVDPHSRLIVEALWKHRGDRAEQVLDEHASGMWQVWAPSNLVPLATALPSSTKDYRVRLRFRLMGGVGDWLIDDVFIDPVKRG